MQQEHTTTYTVDVQGNGRQVSAHIYLSNPGNGPWGSGRRDPVVASIVSRVGALDYIERTTRGHVTRGSLHMYITLLEGAEPSGIADDIRRIVAAFF